MPTITMPLEALIALGVSRAELTPKLTLDAKRALQPLLVPRGFDMCRPILLVELATAEGVGFVLSQ